MKYLNNILIILIASLPLNAQINAIINSGSQSIKNNNINIDYCIGDPINTMQASHISLITTPLASINDTNLTIYQWDSITFAIYPNPATNYIIFNTDNTNNYEIILLDINGRTIDLLYDDTIYQNTDVFIDISYLDLATGSYLIQINKKNAVHTKNKCFIELLIVL